MLPIYTNPEGCLDMLWACSNGPNLRLDIFEIVNNITSIYLTLPKIEPCLAVHPLPTDSAKQPHPSYMLWHGLHVPNQIRPNIHCPAASEEHLHKCSML